MKRKTDRAHAQAFILPVLDYRDERYYEKYSHEEILNKVQEHIDNDEYAVTFPVRMLRENVHVDPSSSDPFPYNVKKSADLPQDKNTRMLMLKHAIRNSPDLFESDNASARGLVAEFGRIVWRHQYGKTPSERREAEYLLKDLILTKTHAKYKKKGYVPPLLSLRQLFNYLHEITKYLKSQYMAKHDDLTDSKYLAGIMEDLKASDRRLYELAKNKQIPLLLRKTKEVTYAKIAKAFGLTVGGLKKQIMKEPKLPREES